MQMFNVSMPSYYVLNCLILQSAKCLVKVKTRGIMGFDEFVQLCSIYEISIF